MQTSEARIPRGFRTPGTTRNTRNTRPKRLSVAESARIQHVRDLRRRTEEATRVMRSETKKLTERLVARGLTIRDIGALLGISYQRVQQIIKGE